METLRVTFVSYDDTPPEGGQGVELEGMRKSVSARAVECSTISGRGDHAVRYPRRTGRAPLDFSWYINRHPELIDGGAAGVVHALGGPGGVLITRKLSRPLVYTANHTYGQAYSRFSPRRPLGMLEMRAYRHAQRVLAISKSTADALIAAGLDASRLEVLSPGVEIPAAVDLSRRDPNMLLFVGRMEAIKGVFDVLTVVDVLRTRLPDVHATLVGTGSLLDEVRREVKRRALPIEVLGRVENEELDDLYARAGAVLMPSAYEGLGLVAAEALARGRPVVGYDVDGLRDIVTASDAGKLVTHGSVLGLSEVTRQYLTQWTAADAAAARDWISRHHSWDAVGERLVSIYRELTG